MITLFNRPPRDASIELNSERCEAFVTVRIDSSMLTPGNMDAVATIMSSTLLKMENDLRKLLPDFIVDGNPHLSQSIDKGILITNGVDFKNAKRKL